MLLVPATALRLGYLKTDFGEEDRSQLYFLENQTLSHDVGIGPYSAGGSDVYTGTDVRISVVLCLRSAWTSTGSVVVRKLCLSVIPNIEVLICARSSTASILVEGSLLLVILRCYFAAGLTAEDISNKIVSCACHKHSFRVEYLCGRALKIHTARVRTSIPFHLIDCLGPRETVEV